LLFVVLVIYRDIELLEPLKPLLSSCSPAGFFLPWIGPASHQIIAHNGAPMLQRYKCLIPFSFIFPAHVSLIFAEFFLAWFSLFSGTFVSLEFRLCQAINFRTGYPIAFIFLTFWPTCWLILLHCWIYVTQMEKRQKHSTCSIKKCQLYSVHNYVGEGCGSFVRGKLSVV